METGEASLRARQEREDRDAGIVKDPDRYVRRRGALYSRAEIETIFSFLRPGVHGIVADLGSGVGRISLALAPRVAGVMAVDFSVESLRILTSRCRAGGNKNVRVSMADIRRLPLARESCDAAVCCQVLQHVPDPAWRADAAAEAFRILKPGGRFVFTVYQWGTMIRDEKEGSFGGRSYRRAFEAEEVLGLLDQAGFRETSVAGVIHAPHALIRHLPVFLWPLEVAASRRSWLRGRASYLLGLGIKPHVRDAAFSQRTLP